MLLLALFSTRLFAADGVIVALHESPSAVSGQTVRIGDVASLFGGTTWDRKNIGELDLESLRDETDCSITRKQVEMRLLLAGYKRNTFQVTGPTIVSAKRTTPVEMRRDLERKLANEIGRQFAVADERVSVRLTNQSHLKSLESTMPAEDFTLELLPRNDFPIGRVRLRVDLIEPTGNRRSLTLEAQVSLAMKVAIASQPIPRGTAIKPAMFRLVDRAITEKADFVNPENASGRIASRYIPNHSILLASHLSSPRGQAGSSVKRNDLLDVVVKLGSSEVRLKNARAMESGIVGDTIEVLNPQTNRRINALLIGPNLATVSSHPRRM